MELAPTSENGYGQAAEAHKPTDPPQQSAMARAHLAAVGRDGRILFRAIMDDPVRKADTRSQEIVGEFDAVAQQLRRLNDQGYGIFYQQNQADGSGWKGANIVGATCYFVDFDGIPREHIDRLGLVPHVEVKTSDGKYHFYFRVDGIPIDTFSATQKRLIKLCGSDENIHDLPRLLRISGFLHQKNPSSPSLVELVRTLDAPPYSHEDFIAALEAAEKVHGIVAATKQAAPTRGGQRGVSRLAASIKTAESVLRHCIAAELINMDERSDWIKVGIALKPYDEDGFKVFVDLSSASDKFDGEADCRARWDSFADDRPQEKRLTIGTFIAMAKETGWSERGEGSAGGSRKPDDASILLELVSEAGDQCFLDKDSTPYVRFRRGTGGEAPWTTARLDDDDYRRLLSRRFHLYTGKKTIAKEQVTSVIGLLHAEATDDNVRRDVHLRVAPHDGRIYIDLGRDDGRAVEVDEEGWRVITDPPVLFVRGSRGQLPIPEKGGKLADLMRHMPNLDREGVQAVLGFAIGSLNPQGTYPMLLFGGGHGTTKSTMADMTVALVDPPNGRQDARYGLAADERDLVIHAARARVLVFDNVSSFGPRESDRLCKMLSGTAFSTRALYSNTGEQRFMMRRPIIATCIGMPTVRGDLIDRMIPVKAQPRSARRTEEAVWRDFEDDWPKLFGLVLEGVSLAIRNRETIKNLVMSGDIKPPRLADFAIFVEGAFELLELQPGQFCALLRGEQDHQQAEAAAADPLGSALVAYFRERPTDFIEGTAAELLSLFSGIRPERERDWPSTNKVSTNLERIKPGLAALGIEVTRIEARGKANRLRFKIRATKAFEAAREAF